MEIHGTLYSRWNVHLKLIKIPFKSGTKILISYVDFNHKTVSRRQPDSPNAKLLKRSPAEILFD